MKVTLPLAALLFTSAIPAAHAQNEFAIAKHDGACPNCSAKEQKILKLQAQIASLKGETPNLAENSTEFVPITPEIAVAAEASDKTYTVVAGDGLMKIAHKTNCKASDLAAVNGMTMDSVIKIGQVLKLPTTATALQTAGVAEEAPKSRQGPPSQSKTYKIQDGETYYSISRRMKISVNELIAANPKIPATGLYTGRVINLPGVGEVPAPAAATSPQTASETPTAVAETPPAPSAKANETPEAPSNTAPLNEKKVIAVSVEEEISYGDFAAKHGTDTDRLNSLNDLSLTSATILAKGSELYVPATNTTAGN